jgi:hypothetical protein
MKRRRSREIKERIRHVLIGTRHIKEFSELVQEIKGYMLGSRPGASHREKEIANNFQYYNDLAVSAMEAFANHLTNNYVAFSADLYRQWVCSLRLGLFSAPDYYVMTRRGLNYPDNASPSPRLESVKKYYRNICK